MAKYDLDTLRHSSAHLMAQAIKRLYPTFNVQFGIGPVIENGFYYDIDLDHKLTDEDLTKIESEMNKIIDENLQISRKVLSREEALKYFTDTKQVLKVELIQDLPVDAEISCYTQGEFTDLCRGPHVERTGELPKSFKLLNTAGAYWRGDSNKKMLQRVYAISFEDKKQLKEHLTFLEEAKKRDHRKLGKDLDLFLFDQHSPGAPFFLPKGAIVYNELVEFIRKVYRVYDYKEVITPQILDAELWKISGHYDNYAENMYFTEIEGKENAVKPMNCPTHMLMYKHKLYSYRDLPLRYADFGRVHRNEKSGTLGGLTRVRSFAQDDGHIFISIDNMQEEIASLIEMFFSVYKHFGFEKIKVNLSTRPEKRVGGEEAWDKAESGLRAALDKSGYQYKIKEGDGAFYGPKIDFEIADAINRYFQLGTIQLDFQLPERFDLNFINKDGAQERPVIIHRALLGSLERFFGIYLEHVSGAYPFWIAPEQAVIVPINNEKHLDACKKLSKELFLAGHRVKIDDRNETMGQKTRQTQQSKIPFMIVIGDKELETNSVNIRKYGDQYSKTITIDEMKKMFYELSLEKFPKMLRE